MLVPNWSLLDVSLAEPASSAGPDWRALAARSLAPSGPNAPEQMVPVMAAYPALRLATVREQGKLLLALPLRSSRLPVTLHRSAATPVSFFGLPHLDPHMAVPALAALLRNLGAPLLLHGVPLGGPLWKALEQAAGSLVSMNNWERASLDISGTYADWFDRSFKRERRKEYRRLAARLAEQGASHAASFQPGDDSARWASDFLALEASGWKGRGGTALASDPRAAATFHDLFAALAAAGKLRVWKLSLDGRPIAMLYAIVEQGEAWLGKIAFDESFARFSPGALLILQATEALFAEGITKADSCAVPDHPLINHLWRDRLAVADVMAAAPECPSLHLTLALQSERLRRSLKTWGRRFRNRLTGRPNT